MFRVADMAAGVDGAVVEVEAVVVAASADLVVEVLVEEGLEVSGSS